MLCAFVSEKSLVHAAICVICFSALVWACVCLCIVCARWEPRWGVPRGQAPAHFLSLSRVPQSGEALSPAICLPALGIVIPKYKPVNISLVTATSPPQHAKRKKKLKKEGDAPFSLTHSFFLCLCLFVNLSLHPCLSSSSWALDAQWGEKNAPFLSCSTMLSA